jgi:mycofactocin precursor
MAETNPQASPSSTIPVEVQPSEEPTDRRADEPEGRPADEPEGRPPEELVEADLLVEEISIDGMCGVY